MSKIKHLSEETRTARISPAPTRRHVLAASALFAVTPLMTALAQTAPKDGASMFISSLGERAITTLRANNITLEQREVSFRALLSHSFDIEFIGRFVLGRHYTNMTPDQRSEYQRLFTEFLLKTYARRLGGYSGESFAVLNSRVTGEKEFMVKTRIERPSGPPIECDWRLRSVDDKFRIIDVVVEGVSMAVTQRQEFTSVIGSSGLEGLLSALRARTERLPARTG
jgi:phospholipid transport system substrate-binding protein